MQAAEKAQLSRWRISKRWGLGATAPSLEVLEADREQRSKRSRFGWALQSIEARGLVARFNQATAQELVPKGEAWTPDLCRELIGPKLTAADAMGLPAWLNRDDAFTADDPQLLALQATATTHSGTVTQVLGVSPAKTGTATLRRLLRLCGYRLEAQRIRGGAGRGAYSYRVVAVALSVGVSIEQLEGA
jgi:hypothetical protein